MPAFWRIFVQGGGFIYEFLVYLCKVVLLRKTILLRLGTKEFQWTSVLGIFLGIITVLMLIKSAAVMFDSWQTVRDFEKCIDRSGVNDFADLSSSEQLLAQLRYSDCKESFFDITGAQLPALQTKLTSRQVITALVEPVAGFFFWAVLFLLSLSLIFNKSIVIPIEEVELAARPFSRKR